MNIWQEVYFAAGQNIVKAKLPPRDTSILLSVSSSAADLAESVYKIHKDYFGHLGKINFQRALPFIGIFALAMTSRWVNKANMGQESMERRNTLSPIAAQVLELFFEKSQERYDEAWFLDAQFRHDIEIAEKGHTISLWNEQILVLYLSARALGAPVTWKLSSPPIPFNSAQVLYSSPGWDPPGTFRLLDISRYMAVSAQILAAEAGMYGSYKALCSKV
jgi:hypothetical protein